MDVSVMYGGGLCFDRVEQKSLPFLEMVVPGEQVFHGAAMITLLGGGGKAG